MENTNEQKLLNKLRENDSGAFKEIYQLYYKKVLTFAASMLGNENDAEEIAQEVFTAIWQQRQSIQISGSIKSYILGIAHHKCFSFIRERIRGEAFVKYQMENKTEFEFVMEDKIFASELMAKYTNLLEKLPEKRRNIFLLSRQDGLTYRQIAQKLNISEHTVDMNIRQAIQFFKENLLEK